MKGKRIAIIIMCVTIMGLSILANARSASTTLYSNETSKTTAAVGNSGSGFSWWGSVGTTSMYNVTYAVYGGANSNNCTNLLGSWAKAPGSSFPASLVSSTYSVGKLTMYGNTINNPKKDCIAAGGIN